MLYTWLILDTSWWVLTLERSLLDSRPRHSFPKMLVGLSSQLPYPETGPLQIIDAYTYAGIHIYIYIHMGQHGVVKDRFSPTHWPFSATLHFSIHSPYQLRYHILTLSHLTQGPTDYKNHVETPRSSQGVTWNPAAISTCKIWNP